MNTNSATLGSTNPGNSHAAPVRSGPNLDVKPGRISAIAFIAVAIAGLIFTAYSLVYDVNNSAMSTATWLPFLLLGVALLIALGFEFVNGFMIPLTLLLQ